MTCIRARPPYCGRCDYLRGPVRWLRPLLLIPTWLRDPLYDLIARNRYRWFGQPAHLLRRRPPQRAIASSICEPATVAHQPADQWQADLHVEAKTPLLFRLRSPRSPATARAAQAGRSTSCRASTSTSRCSATLHLEIEVEDAEPLDDPARRPAHADELPRAHDPAADAARPDLTGAGRLRTRRRWRHRRLRRAAGTTRQGSRPTASRAPATVQRPCHCDGPASCSACPARDWRS